MSFAWARHYPDLHLTCRTFAFYELDDAVEHFYKPLPGILQEGPQCGLVALTMCTDEPNKEKVSEIFSKAKDCKYTNNGEILSVDSMFELSKNYLKNKIEIYNNNLHSDEIIKFLLNGGIMLVPYDCDRDHTPCLRNGHKAHWAAISGIVVTEDEVHVIARHGKSFNLAIWKLTDLARSNEQLKQFSPDRTNSDLIYVLPERGLGGPNGLCQRSILIHPLNDIS